LVYNDRASVLFRQEEHLTAAPMVNQSESGKPLTARARIPEFTRQDIIEVSLEPRQMSIRGDAAPPRLPISKTQPFGLARSTDVPRHRYRLQGDPD
jgi:hypothetical protein